MCQCYMPGYENRRGNTALIIVYRYVKRIEKFDFTVFSFVIYYKLHYKLL